MPGNSRDPGLQPERTSLAWVRTLLGYGALLALALRHAWNNAGLLIWLALGGVAAVAGLIYVYARQRRLTALVHEDFSAPGQVRAKLAIALAVCALALLFVVTHLHALIALLAE
ncbi:DUF202 domain-containing protein [Cronobacter malonaticus]|uniref:DUF202 domain-containing protein n=1 Tax=Cronobacter malonaticus TaxID=413503 RepID=UPI000519194C|nr:DUF202 domain-containing protein [Cronobacter malonaticus]EGT4373763.1 DUF202 domain-containing protein [Cronobacter malonaticus]ELY2623154.1 DUF202 domain-containing protein [Cronobacter malonaticus]ELY3624205.1 DUF202 domain-containing protein [Cronobacter malonaticus]ELY6229824.1 DUF202 domain-containing protein [Cronobacter malonaticus]EMA8639117.1 DUF202 domain-containing protein [Cronobacter malonaticus]